MSNEEGATVEFSFSCALSHACFFFSAAGGIVGGVNGGASALEQVWTVTLDIERAAI